MLAREIEKRANWYRKGIDRIGKFIAPAEKPFEAVAKFVEGVPGSPLIGGALGATYGMMGEDGNFGSALMGGMAGMSAPGLIRGVPATVRLTGKMLKNPIQTVHQGWQAQSPLGGLRRGQTANETQARVRAETEKVYSEGKKHLQERDYSGIGGRLKSWWHGSDEAARSAALKKYEKKWQPLVDAEGKAKYVGEADSWTGALKQRGWTGMGKPMTALFAVPTAATLYGATQGNIPWSQALTDIGGQALYMGGGSMKGFGLGEGMVMSGLTTPVLQKGFQTAFRDPSEEEQMAQQDPSVLHKMDKLHGIHKGVRK